MSLSTRRPPGIPSSVRPPRSAFTTPSENPVSCVRDASPLPSNSAPSEYRAISQSQRSRSVPRQESDNPFRSRRGEEAPPLPSISSRHSSQSSVSSLSSGSSVSGSSVSGSSVSSASTTASSFWDYVGWKTNTTAPADGHEERIPSPELVESRSVGENPGTTLWSRVAAVAGGLTVNVGKVWDTKDDLPEPDTPPGCDSRVTTALKKHYIKQVSDPRQLPDWLFSDVERQVKRGYTRTEPTPAAEDGSTSARAPPVPAPIRSQARHDDAYVHRQSEDRGESVQSDMRNEWPTGPTRATTRLRALRDAKRGPVAREVDVPHSRSPDLEPEPIEAVPPPRLRVGLPARPTRVRRDG